MLSGLSGYQFVSYILFLVLAVCGLYEIAEYFLS